MTLFAATPAPAATGGFDSNNLLTIGLVVVFAVMIIFMFRNSRKRRRDQEEMQSKLIPGTEVMTTHGIYGHIISIDDEKNEAVIETTPGTRLRLHRQTLSRVVEPTVADTAATESATTESTDGSPEVPDDASSLIDGEKTAKPVEETSAPEYGERTGGATTDPTTPKRTPRSGTGTTGEAPAE